MYCKTCGKEINSSNSYLSDSRFCLSCGAKRAEFIAYRKETLKSLRQMNLNSKIIQTKYLIKQAVNEFGIEHVYISYSGGKDSTVLSHIAKQIYVFHERKENQSRPLSFWTNEDINEYIRIYNVKISKLYNMGYSRNGCMYCGFGVQMESGKNRFQRLSETHPIQYSYFVENFSDLVLNFDIQIV